MWQFGLFAYFDHCVLDEEFLALLAALRIFLLAADIGFVDFDNPAQFSDVTVAGFAQPAQHEPSGFLSDADSLGQLHRRNTLPHCDDDIHGIEPFVKLNMGMLEDRARADGKFLAALIVPIVAETFIFPHRNLARAAAMRASHPQLPAPLFKILASGLLIGEHLE